MKMKSNLFLVSLLISIAFLINNSKAIKIYNKEPFKIGDDVIEFDEDQTFKE